MFTDKFSGYFGEIIECERGGIRFVARLYADDDMTPPWDREDGHGPVSDWTRDAKLSGQMILNEDRGSRRYYDFREACRIARRNGWGVLPYRTDIERGANGMSRVTGQWFQGRDLQTFRSDWSDDLGDCYRQIYDAHRATMSARQYAAAAAMSDYERLRQWCACEWQYVGVAVQAFADDMQLTGEFDHALWGIESDAGEYLTETANDYLAECETAARAAAVKIGTRLAALVSA